MWLIVVWQLAQIADDTFWKSTRPPPLVGLATLPNGHTPRYGATPPTSVPPVVDSSAGNRRQSNVSWTQRTRRNAKFEKNCCCTPGLVRTPDLGPPLAHSTSVIVVPLTVGQPPVFLVNRSV